MSPTHRPPGLDPDAVAVAVRAGFFEPDGQVVRGERGWMTADSIYDAVVADLVTCNGLEQLPAVDRSRLDRAWRAMPAWPDAPDSIATLRQRYVVVPLTILSWPMQSAVPGSPVSPGTGSFVDLLGVYEPDPDASRVPTDMGCAPRKIMKVAAHPSDLRAAMAAGRRTVYVLPKLQDPGEDYSDTSFDASSTS